MAFLKFIEVGLTYFTLHLIHAHTLLKRNVTIGTCFICVKVFPHRTINPPHLPPCLSINNIHACTHGMNIHIHLVKIKVVCCCSYLSATYFLLRIYQPILPILTDD